MSNPRNVVSQGTLSQAAATIANGQTTSGVIATDNSTLVGIQLAATMTGTALTFTVATSAAGTYQPLYNSGGQVSYTVASGRYIAIDPKDFYGVQFFKIVSGSSEGAARSLTCMLKGI